MALMIDLAAWAFGGFIVFLILLVKHAPYRPGDRGPETLLAGCTAITFILMFLEVAGIIETADRSAFAGAARILALNAGAACAYFAYRLFRRAKHRSPRHRPLERPRMSPEYEAASRRMDEIFGAMLADALRGPPSSRDPRKIPSYAKMIGEASEAMLREAKREPQSVRAAKMAGLVFIGIAGLYALTVILTA